MNKLKFIDVCAGIGGFRMAMENYGHECVYSVEYDKHAIKAHHALWEDDDYKVWYDDMRKLDYSTLPDFDVLCAGFPCAKFSIAGDREGFESDDPRATVFYELMKITKIKKPKYLLFENVKGLLNHDDGKSFGTIISKMDELGYNVEWQLVNAKDFGYPVLRERVFIVGHLRGASTEKVFPITEGSRPHDSQTCIYQFRRGNFRRFKGYCPTLTASMGTGGNNVPFVIHNNALRKLTPTELFRLQGISEEHIHKLVNSGLPDSALYERAGRTIFVPVVKKIVEKFR